MKNKIFTLALRSISSPMGRLGGASSVGFLFLLLQLCFWQQSYAACVLSQRPTTLTIASPTAAVAAANRCAGNTNIVIHAFNITASGGSCGSSPLQNFQFTTTGTYAATDIANFKIWTNSNINNQFTADISGTVLTVSALTVAGSSLWVGQVIYGAGITAGTVITSLGTGTGGVGTYNINNSQTIASEAMSGNGENFATAIQVKDLGGGPAMITSPTAAGVQIFPSQINELMVRNITEYFWITMDVATWISTDGNTIAVSGSNATDMIATGAYPTNVSVRNGGPTTASGIQTLYNIPVITTQPVSVSTCQTYTAVFNVAASGSGLTYQWQEYTGASWANISNGGVYSGATTAALTLTGVTLGMSGYQYQCIVYCSGVCPATSVAATLTVTNTAFAYGSSTVTQNNKANVTRGTNYNEVIAIPIVMTGNCTLLNITSFSLNTTGSTAPLTDISSASIWYTGASSVFSTASLFGTQASPNGAFTITGTQVLAPGTNYFWLSYNVPSGAIAGNVLDAQCSSVTIGGVAHTPTTTDPAGSRAIVAVNNWLWAKDPDAIGDQADIVACATDALNNVYYTGWFDATVTFGTTTLTANNWDIILVKYDPWGTFLWAKKAGSTTSNASDDGQSVATNAAGDVFITGTLGLANGSFGSITVPQAGVYLAKYNSSGTEQWVKTAYAGGGIGMDVAVDASGNIYVTGYFAEASITFGAYTLTNSNGGGAYDAFVVKYSASGAVLWAKRGGGAGANTYAYSVAADGSGNVFVGGNFNANAANASFGIYTLTPVQSTIAGTVYGDFFLVKYDASGNELWAQEPQGGTGPSLNAAYGLAADAFGNVYMTGLFSSATNFQIGTTVLTGAGQEDMFLAKYNAAGAVQWAVSGGGTGQENGYDMAINPLNGHLFVVGTDWFTFNAGSSTYYFTGTTATMVTVTGGGGAGSLFIVEYDAAGIPQCGSALFNGGEEKSGVAADSWGNAYVAGDYTGGLLTVGSTTLTIGAPENAYVAKWSSCVAIPLGVEWLDFTATCSEGKAKLNWSTASETNNDYFTIERATPSNSPTGGGNSLPSGGLEWTSIGTVKGVGNSSMTTNYTFTDAAPGDGISYYRIKQTDHDGKSDYSKIVSFNKNNCFMSVYPNPFDKTLYVSSGTGTAVNALFRVVNVLGQEVYARNIIIPGDGTSLAIDLPLLASGMYVVLVNDADNSTLLLNTKVVRVGVGE